MESAPAGPRYDLRALLEEREAIRIHAAWDSDLRRLVALKRLSAREAGADPERLRRFVREARVAGALDHPGVASVHEVGIDAEGALYFTMQQVSGGTLASLLARAANAPGSAELARCLEALAKVCDTLAYAHSKGIVHGALRPEHVVLGEFGEVYLTEWGSTPDEAAATPSVDVRAVGELLGALPVRRGRARLDAIHRKALAETPEASYRDARELAEDLHAFLENRVVRAHASGPLAEVRAWCRRNRAVSSVAIGTLVALLLGGSFWLLRLRAAFHESLTEQGIAESHALRAQEERALADRSLGKVLRLALLDQSRELRRLADGVLWPLLPANAAALRAWIQEAESVLARIDLVHAEIEALRAESEPIRDGEPGASNSPLRAELAGFRRRRSLLEPDHPDFETFRAASIEERIPTARAAFDEQIEKLEREVERRERRFVADATETAEQKAWRYAQLLELERELVELGAEPTAAGGELGLVESSLPSVRRRLEFVEAVARQLSDPTSKEAWEEVRLDFAKDPRTRDLALPIPGLVPLGSDPASGLWEFWHVPSGERPEPDPAYGQRSWNRWLVTEETGLVFVLVPGGPTRLGAQRDPRDPHYDRWAEELEAPVHEVDLAPYLISKYELTEAQWRRVGDDPLRGTGEMRTARGTSAVAAVSWTMCETVLRRLGLTFPTEAQWEHATRAGSSTPWWCSDDPADLRAVGHVNVAARGLDPRAFPAPVGLLRANAFGLHDVHGNVMEWCLDETVRYELRGAPGDGVRLITGRGQRSRRGGAFLFGEEVSRSSWRTGSSPVLRGPFSGVRPALAARRPEEPPR